MPPFGKGVSDLKAYHELLSWRDESPDEFLNQR